MYYPVFLNLQNKKCVVIGGGNVAKRKATALLKANASITIISPVLSPGLKRLISIYNDKIKYHKKSFHTSDIKGAFLVIGATQDRDTNSEISSYCKKRGILVNIVDSPDESNFIVPSVVRRGDLIFAVSTSGVSPALAKRIRKELSSIYGHEYAKFLSALRDVRKDIIKNVTSPLKRHKILSGIVKKYGPSVSHPHNL